MKILLLKELSERDRKEFLDLYEKINSSYLIPISQIGPFTNVRRVLSLLTRDCCSRHKYEGCKPVDPSLSKRLHALSVKTKKVCELLC